MIKTIKLKIISLLYQLRVLQDYLLADIIKKKSPHAAPDFIIIGAAKSGTTSLYQYLAQHPDIEPSLKKEAKYFGMSRQINGLNAYLKNFPLKENMGDKITFEATPTYLYLDNAPKRIAKIFPDIKFIAILRDPIARAFSHWNFNNKPTESNSQRVSYDQRTFREAIKEELEGAEGIDIYNRYVDRGFYDLQLENTLKYIDRDQLLVLDQADLKNNPVETLNKVTDFLGVSYHFEDFKPVNQKEGEAWKPKKEEDKKLKMYNVNKYDSKIDEDLVEKLDNVYAKHNSKLKKLMGRSFSWMKEN